MSAPLIFVLLPLIAAMLAYGARQLGRPRLAVALGVLVALVLALLALTLPLDQPLTLLGSAAVRNSLTILGRKLTIEPGDRLALAFICSQAALLFVGAWLGETARLYVPAGLAVLSLLAAALFIQPFLFAILFLLLAASLAVPMLVPQTDWGASLSRRRPVGRGALRFLVFMTLGMPFILLAGWQMESSLASPEDISFITRATWLLGAGFAVLLAVAPFHSWLPAMAEHSPPLGAAFVFTVFQFAVVFWLLTFLSAYGWLRENPAIYRVLLLAGAGMVLIGAVFVFGQRNLGRSVGYGMMIDTGAVLLAIGLGTRVGVQVAVATLALRGVALTAWGMGLERLRRAAGSDDFDSLRGLARRRPLATAMAVLGLFSLAGFPLTAGFPGRWALLSLLAQTHPSAGMVLFLGTASLILVGVRGLGALLTPADTALESGRPSEGRLAIAVYGLVLALLIAGGFFPQWVLAPVTRAVDVFWGIP